MTQPAYEIALPNGFGYVCILRQHPTYGDILGVDPVPYDGPTPDLSKTTHGQIVIFPLLAAIKSGTIMARHVGDLQAPVKAPLAFKFAVRDSAGQPLYWWLWDGDQIEIAKDHDDLAGLPDRTILTSAQFLALWQ